MQIYNGWKEFHSQKINDKLLSFLIDDKIFDIIYAQQLDLQYIESLFSLADKIRKIAKDKAGCDYLRTILSDKRAMLFFNQPSTRTFLSFLNACQILGMQISEIRDSSTSSEVKGESPEDMIRTFSSYVDLIIVRHNDEGFAERAAWTLNNFTNRPVPVINGGSGKDQHPTQALLDIYTLKRSIGISNKKIAMIGDLKRGRTVRSLCRLLALYENVEIYFVSPEEFQMRKDILGFLQENNIKYHLSNNIYDIIGKVDAFYCTRIQDEHDEDGESSNIDMSKFALTEAMLKKMKQNAVIMHPFPRRNEIDVAIDNDKRALYWKQSRNGMWIRAAIMVKILGREGEVNFKVNPTTTY